MGTNYYLHTCICNKCKRSDTLHIGKSSYGWTFSFRGYRNNFDDPKITSYKEWITILSDAIIKGCEIRNEYNEIVQLEEFKELVESKRNSTLNHTTYCIIQHPEHAERDCWLDDEGNSFSSGEFS